MKYFIDFESSGLNMQLSYPIQVGWINEDYDGSELLIEPVSNWNYWSIESENIHKISRDSLKDGLPVLEVCHRMNSLLGGKEVYCDGGSYDQFWLFRLFEAANIRPQFELLNYFDLIRMTLRNDSRFPIFYHNFMNLRKTVTHNAYEDAKHILNLYKNLDKYSVSILEV